MKPHLLLADADVDVERSGLPFAEDLVQDLQLAAIVQAMGPDDEYLRRVGLGVLLHPLTDAAAVERRQELLAEVLADPQPMKELYDVAVAGVKADRGFLFMPVRNQPALMLNRDVRLLDALYGVVEQLRTRTAAAASAYRSRAFTEFAGMIGDQLDDAFMAELKQRIRQLAFPEGLLMTAGIRPDGQVGSQTLRTVDRTRMSLFHRVPLPRPYSSFVIPERDESGHDALALLRERSLGAVADAATAAADHIMAFFTLLRAETGFALAAVNLHAALSRLGIPLVFPAVAPDAGIEVDAIVDPGLGLRERARPVGSDLHAGTRVVIITGANQGGKSTMLRAIGIARLMGQAGLFVAATRARMGLPARILTHWTREEEQELQRGKLDDELARMSAILDRAAPGDLLLCNESFASTNEAEGSQIAFELTRTLAAHGITVVFVTHQYEFARLIAQDAATPAVFLRAERGVGGARPHRLVEGEPLPSSYAVDVYDRAFGTHFAHDAQNGGSR